MNTLKNYAPLPFKYTSFLTVYRLKIRTGIPGESAEFGLLVGPVIVLEVHCKSRSPVKIWPTPSLGGPIPVTRTASRNVHGS